MLLLKSTICQILLFRTDIIETERRDLMYRERIKALREDHDKTQKEIAAILYTSQRVYSRYETGAAKLPIHHLITLCQYYNVSPEYILGFTDTPKPLPEK